MCSLNGQCGSAGLCECDSGWRGAQCEWLDLLPAPRDSARQAYKHDAFTSWGGNSVLVNGTWHLFVAQMSGRIGDWKQASKIVRATSSTPEGPYAYAEDVLPAFAHNPQVVALPGGRGFRIFHIGSGKPFKAKDNGCGGLFMARASSVLGPWRDAPLPIASPQSDWDRLGFNCSDCAAKGCGGCFTSAPRCAPWAAGCPTNPSPLLLPNGSALMVAEGGYGCRVGERVALFASPSGLDGPWKLASPPLPAFSWSEDPFCERLPLPSVSFANPLLPARASHLTDCPGPCRVVGIAVWRTKRGFHLLTHSGSPCVLGYSIDGQLWHTASNGGGYNYTVEWEGPAAGSSSSSSNATTKLRRRERPHLIFDPAQPETPLVLLNGVEDPTFGREYTLAQRVRHRAKSSPHVPGTIGAKV